MKKVLFCFVLMMAFAIVFSEISPAFAKNSDEENDFTEKFVRIHIRAKSNGSFDQAVKLKVRDNVVNYLSDRLVGVKNKKQALEILEESLTEIKRICDITLYCCGADYTAQVRLGKENFPERDYGGLVLPCDEYDALIITLHSGEGENWWCIAYPPLCFVGGMENPNAPEEITYDSLIVRFVRDLLSK